MTRRTVVFDVGGVIVRWEPLALMREHFPQVDAQAAFSQVFEHWGPGDWRDFDLGRVEPDALADHLETSHACFAPFEQRAWSGRIGLAKPERAIFDHLQTMLGVSDATQLLFIDDHEGNVDAARGLGWQALHFRSSAQAEADLRALGFL